MPDREDGKSVTLFLCGDVMTGRGIDQVLPHPVDPVLHEAYMKSAVGYVRIAEEATGPIRKPVGFSYIWGDALDELERRAPDLRIINLETSITTSTDHWRGKEIHYRMNPANIPCLTAARISCCALANNHTLDWGYAGLEETLASLKNVNISTSGAGMDLREAETPAVLEAGERGRVLVFSFGTESSGIPPDWAAMGGRPGVNFLRDLSAEAVRHIGEKVLHHKQPEDLVVLSIHWGENWGYEVAREERTFAHRVIDHAGIDVIHGHSSHHVKGIEVYKGKLILYGCGDFINDYEGIGGLENYRGDLGLMYFVCMNPLNGKLVDLWMTPTQIRHFRVNRAQEDDRLWLKNVLIREGGKFGTGVAMSEDGSFTLQWT